jgi:transposase
MANGEIITISKEEYNRFMALQDEVNYLTHQLAELKRLIFGSKRERFISLADPQQATLFDLPEAEQVEEKKIQVSYQRTKNAEKKQPLRAPLPENLPRKTQVIEPENLPEEAKKIGVAVTEVLDYVPAYLHVWRIERPKYVIATGDEKTEITIADLPSLPIPKGNAGAGLLSHILISKFVDHLPFYRQVRIFKRHGVDIAESTIGGWFAATCQLLEPLYQTLKNQLLTSDYLMADETPLPVLTKDKPGATHKGYHWVYYDPLKRLVLFDYRKTRSREGPEEILENFSGHLQTDGYDVYHQFEKRPDITLLSCMAHARRYFDKARDNDPERASKALKMFQGLYETERIMRQNELSADQIRTVRQWISVPELEVMENWFKEEIYKVAPKSAIGKAFAYSLRLWYRLKRYVEDGRFHIDNNPVENSIRPVALGRKNYLFAGSHEAAQNAAMIYSLLATCKLKNVEPFQWLKDVLTRIPDHPANKLYELLP